MERTRQERGNVFIVIRNESVRAEQTEPIRAVTLNPCLGSLCFDFSVLV